MKWDLNLDAGEDPRSLADGSESRLYAKVARVNIACGGHAGDEASMRQAVRLASAAATLVGAHPSYPDRKNFGRTALAMPPAEVTRFVALQVGDLLRLCEGEDVRLVHVKPHGALYNVCAGDEALAVAIAEGVRQIDASLTLVGLAGSRCLEVWNGLGFQVLAEGFADRSYRFDGTLVPRSQPGAVITDPKAAAAQAKGLLEQGKVRAITGESLTLVCHTVCVHGDNPAAQAILSALHP